MPQRIGKNGTNLYLGEDWQEDIRDVTPGAPRPNEQKGINGIKGRRFDKHYDDGLYCLVQTAGFGRSSHRVSDVYVMQGESYNYHQREEDVE